MRSFIGSFLHFVLLRGAGWGVKCRRRRVRSLAWLSNHSGARIVN